MNHLRERRMILNFLNDFLDCIDAREVEVANVTRIGARSKDKKKDRPIKDTCKSSDQKREVMRKVSNLKFIADGSAQECFKKVSVPHDMSKAERQVNKLKFSKAKEKPENDSQEGNTSTRYGGLHGTNGQSGFARGQTQTGKRRMWLRRV